MASAGRPELPDGEDSGAFIKSFGVQVKLLRERAGLTQAELGSRVGYGADQIAAVEQGRRIPKPELIDKADEVLGGGGLLKAMKGEVARARYPAFFRDAARIEAGAVEVHSYDVQVMNGLLQTDDYARAMFTLRRPLLDEETVEQRVAARVARQAIFDARPAPLLSFVVEEAVLQRPFGGKCVLRGQLEQLLLIGQKRHVEIQVMPTAREDNAGIDGPFILMTAKGGEQVAYLEGQGRSTLLTDREHVRTVAARYGIIRAQALTPRESSIFIEKLLGEL
ncbi:helix-turn-helix transcriptional regulator [Streptomyces sp. NEAU-YJ-81]|uniref:helix-turn-helix domain-containing protein n=1 Tax=Streptomyces sp. NEAU-YJ-81 TaxID=2820288 RepID=UPI001ABCC1EB|nr:helix-turn-helix transcriptional regulator [Streptomyces sp. NEAU-YJ-81]MBO3678344.1 helix-turn-helix transcriptional regulator [Streptomyces sp. NEAU-YJ-81]